MNKKRDNLEFEQAFCLCDEGLIELIYYKDNLIFVAIFLEDISSEFNFQLKIIIILREWRNLADALDLGSST